MDAMLAGLLGWIQAFLPQVVAVSAGISLFLFILLLVLIAQIRGLHKRMRAMLQGDGVDLEENIRQYHRQVRLTLERLEIIDSRLREIEYQKPGFIQRIGLVRFNAFPEVGSDLSFAVAMLDDRNDGVVISSIYGREDSRTFAKPVKAGKSSYRLTAEEEAAIAQARRDVKHG